MVKDIDTNAESSYIVLDEKGELFKAKDKELIKRFEEYEWTGSYINDTTTVYKNEEGNIGIASIDNIYDVIYYSNDGNYIGNSNLSRNNYYVDDEDWIVFIETEKDEYFTTTKYGIKDKQGNVILPAVYNELRFLSGTENIMVNSTMGSGIIRLEVN